MAGKRTAGRSPTDEEILARIPAARARAEEADRTEPRAVAARYDAGTGRVMVELRNGCAFAFPPGGVKELRGVDRSRVEQVEVDPFGAGLRWEAIDVDLSVAGLVADLFGGRSRIGQVSAM